MEAVPSTEVTMAEINSKPADPVSQVRAIAAQLDALDKTYFGKDRQKQIRGKIDEALALLEQQPIDLEKNKKQKADILYLRGKCMDYLPEYSKQAEENLSKSIKLMPTKKEAWDALAHVYWKKRDIEQAKKCFEGSLELDQDNKTALNNLSMVFRMLTTSSNGEPIDAEERKKNF